ncbi:SMC-Scp complex subunit ScpB [Pseudonocardia sp. NPDC046786]|uniref:SMC-Scp complex subunit ScpB n=1 Tax=Pseudonocardia sp. NPDC046786 TaxID=3155471 RepID=UPI0033F7053E
MAEPDDRPGSADPEDPSELMRLIGRTVPRSPHAGTERTAAGPDENRADVRDDDEPARTRAPGAEPAPATDRPSDDPTADDSAADDSAAKDLAADAPALTEPTDDAELEKALEALLLVVDTPVDEESLATTLGQTPVRIRQTLDRMSRTYTADARGIDLRRVGGGWRFYTRDRYAPYVEKLLLDGQRARLTRAALETLAVVAYRQPVTRARVAAVRGVNCDGVLRTLLTRGLVEEAGTEEHTGGTLFRTTEVFLERLGLSSVQELPPLAPLLPDIDAIDDLES